MTHPLDTPSPTAPVPATGWTPERKALFLDRLSVHGNARAACRAVGLSAEAAYRLRRRDPLFARGWAAAIVLGRENTIQVLGERAVEGVEEEIFYRGELIGTRRRYDSRLLLAHLARLDRIADENTAGGDAGRFDELIAAIARVGGDDTIPSDRDRHIQDAADAAREKRLREELAAAPELASEYEGFAGTKNPWKSDNVGEIVDDEDREERLELIDRSCQIAADRAREAAGREWDETLHVRHIAIDALCDGPERAACLRAATGPAALPAALAASGSADRQQPPLSSPCTLSTVSTSALATALAGEPPRLASQPLSPLP